MPGTTATATAVPPTVLTTSTPSAGPDPVAEPDASAYAESYAESSAVPSAVDVEEAPRGRHSRVEEPAAEYVPPPASGRHARGRGPAPRTRARRPVPTLPLEPLELDLDGRPLAPEEVDQIADQMLDRLAVTEERPRFFDPEELPGGKFVFMAGCGFAVLVLLVVMYTVLGLFLNRS